MADVSVTHVIDSQGERAISENTTVASPFKLKGRDVAGHSGTATVSGGMSFSSKSYQADSGGVWQTDDFTISPTGSYTAWATCSDTMQQSNVVDLSVT